MTDWDYALPQDGAAYFRALLMYRVARRCDAEGVPFTFMCDMREALPGRVGEIQREEYEKIAPQWLSDAQLVSRAYQLRVPSPAAAWDEKKRTMDRSEYEIPTEG